MGQGSSGSSFSSATMPRPLKKFYLGEPLALGITQILTGCIEIAFGIVVEVARSSPYEFMDFLIKTPIWTGILYIISGSLTTAAARNPKMSLVKGMLGMNVVSAVAAGVAIVIFAISLAHLSPPDSKHYWCHDDDDPHLVEVCQERKAIPYAITYGIAGILFAFTLLEFFITIITAAFGCSTVCRESYTETTVIIYQNTVGPEPPALPLACEEEEEAP